MTRTTAPRAVRRTTVAALTAALVALTAPFSPAAAESVDAEEPTVCSDERIVGTGFPGDLVVPDGAWCEVWHVAVTGDAVVGEGAELMVGRSAVKGDLRLAPDASTGLWWATLWGGIQADDAETVNLAWSTVHRSIRGDSRNVTLGSSTVRGAVNMATPMGLYPYPVQTVLVSDSTVGGWVNLHGGPVRIENATLERGLTASGSGLLMCSSSIAADVTVRWSHTWIEIGAMFGDKGCTRSPATHNMIGGSVYMIDNPHSILLTRTMIAGDLVCTGNTGPRGVNTSDAVVEGERVGQCA